MIQVAQDAIAKFRSKGVLLDSNMLFLLLAGLVDPKQVGKLRRTKQYSEDHWVLLASLLEPVRTHKTTPHVATEVDNLAGLLPQYYQDKYRAYLAEYVRRAKESREESRKIVGAKIFKTLGLADTAVSRLSKKNLVVTDDFPLSYFIENQGGNVINFTNLWFYVQ